MSDMYAIVKTGGKQYRVEEGQTFLVERLRAEEGDTVALQPLLLRGDGDGDGDDDVAFAADELARASVAARVVAHERGPKLRVLKFKPKRGYKKRTGHRQDLTRLQITEIATGAGSAGRGGGQGRPAGDGGATAGEETGHGA